jgi:hypothetical protein
MTTTWTMKMTKLKRKRKRKNLHHHELAVDVVAEVVEAAVAGPRQSSRSTKTMTSKTTTTI